MQTVSGDALLRLPLRKGQLEFQYTATSLSQPEKIHFKYMLEGFDKDWNDAGTRCTAYYTNISAGKYRFRVIASNADGVWPNAAVDVAIVLRPHFYETLTFAIAVSLGVLGFLFGTYRIRVNQLRAQQRKLERLVCERTEALTGSKRKFQELAENSRSLRLGAGPNQSAGSSSPFGKKGHRVMPAGNGREAIHVLEGSNWNFDGVLMDVQMPEMDGLEATRAIRKMEANGTRRIPIFALTAHAMDRDKEICLAAGMDRQLAKPIQSERLFEVLREISSGVFETAAAGTSV